MQNIETISNAKTEFSDCLQEIMEDKGVFTPATHKYLTDVMAQYVAWEESQFSSGIHTRDTKPFVFQINGIGETHGTMLNSRLWYLRLRSIAETLLVAVGYWPESISSTPRRNRPSLKYYASIGATAYARAAQMQETKLMRYMADGFRDYAGVLHHFRCEMGNPPVRNVEVLFKLAEFLGDDAVIKRYLVDVSTEESKSRIH